MLLDYLLHHAVGYRTDPSGEYKLRQGDLVYQTAGHLMDGAEMTVNLSNFSAGV
jgi:hypothetical protein